MFADGITLERNAWYARLVKLVWHKDNSDFPNLCPFFWTVIGTIIIFPLWCIIASICWLIKRPTVKKIIFNDTLLKILNFIIDWFFTFVASLLIGWWLTCLFLSIFYILEGSKFIIIFSLVIVGLIVLMLLIVYITCFFCDVTEKSNSDNKSQKPHSTRKVYQIICKPFYMIGQFGKLCIGYAYAIYKKCCPMINWK